MIKDAWGKTVEFYPIHRSLLASTDDTTLFISPGKLNPKPKEEMTLVSAIRDNKTQMNYKRSSKDDEENAKGMCVKLTFTFIGCGQMLNPYVTVAGLTERELPSAS